MAKGVIKPMGQGLALGFGLVILPGLKPGNGKGDELTNDSGVT